MLSVRLAWRNIWRNGKRTAITMTAISLNTAISILSFALMAGLADRLTRNATRIAVGDAQVHAPGYRQDRSIYKSMPNAQGVLDAARARGVQAVPRSYGFGLLASGPKSAGAVFWGVDPGAERSAFDLPGELDAGRYLAHRAGRGVVLGRRLAKSLQVGVGDEVIAMVQAADGSLGNERFRVEGILKSVGDDIDFTTAILHADDFSELFVSGGRVHEIALRGTGGESPESVVRAIAAAAPGMEVLTWQEILPQLSSLLAVWGVAMTLFGGIFAAAAGVGVTNTMLMAAYERMPEFGILKALGSTPWRIVRDMSTEALMMALLATAIGAALGSGAAIWLRIRGLDLSPFVAGTVSLSGAVFDPVLRPALSPLIVIAVVVSMWVVTVAAALYPAAKAARIDPVKAISHV